MYTNIFVIIRIIICSLRSDSRASSRYSNTIL